RGIVPARRSPGTRQAEASVKVTSRLIVASTLALGPTAPGCFRAAPAPAPPPAAGSGSVLVGGTTAWYGTWDGRLVVLVWADTHAGTGGTSGGKLHGSLALEPPGKRIEIDAATQDGRAGTVTIDGKAYDLADGGLFLVSTRDGQVQIRQVKR